MQELLQNSRLKEDNIELKEEVSGLKEDNIELKETNDELNYNVKQIANKLDIATDNCVPPIKKISRSTIPRNLKCLDVRNEVYLQQKEQ